MAVCPVKTVIFAISSIVMIFISFRLRLFSDDNITEEKQVQVDSQLKKADPSSLLSSAGRSIRDFFGLTDSTWKVMGYGSDFFF
jgi:Golgi nucleoside diphosphatase